MAETMWARQCKAWPYVVVLRPGCYRGPDAPVVSRHRSLAAAVRMARSNDRYQVEPAKIRAVLYAPAPRSIRGLLGDGPQPGEPSLRECIAAAERAVAELRAAGRL